MLPPVDGWFFITGCQRLGTTLLTLLLECHPEVFCFDELDSYRVLSSSQFGDTISEPRVGFKVPRWAEQLDCEVLRDFGLPYEGRRIYQGQKILFLVRDYRDAISSMLKLSVQPAVAAGRSSGRWLRMYALDNATVLQRCCRGNELQNQGDQPTAVERRTETLGPQ